MEMHSVKVLRMATGYSLVARVTDLPPSHLRFKTSMASRIISEMLPEIHTTERVIFSNL